MRPRSTLIIVGLCGFVVLYASATAFGVTLSRGRQIQLSSGLHIQGLAQWGAAPTSTQVDLWKNSNFTVLNTWDLSPSSGFVPPILAKMPAGQAWGRMWRFNWYLNYMSNDEKPYAGNLVSMQYVDELTDLADSARLTSMATHYANWKSLYPKALAYTNFGGGGLISGDTLTTYMNTTQPDQLSFDVYPKYLGTSFASWYSCMSRYRTAALAGYTLNSGPNAGQNSGPIPYHQFLNLFRSSYTDALPSESFVRLQQNASWAFGYTSASAFVYGGFDYASVYPTMYNAAGHGSPTPVYNYVKEANRQSRNLGPALVRLVSTGVFMSNGTIQGSKPANIDSWTPGAGSTDGYTDYIANIMPYTNASTLGGYFNGQYRDTIIGYFKPLLASNPGATFADGLHFMIVNAAQGSDFAYNSTTGDPASNWAQWYYMTFDFTGSTFDSLVRLSRDTGEVELVPLTHYGAASAKTYFLDLKLDGGTGDLFAFWNSSQAFPTIPEPGTSVLLLTGVIGVLVYFWPRRA